MDDSTGSVNGVASQVSIIASDVLNQVLELENAVYQSGYPVRVYGNGIPMVPAATYNPAGGLASYTTGDGTTAGFTTTIQPDGTGLPRPARIFTGATTDGFSVDTGTYAYDGVGNITAIGADAFAYDTESRLISSSLSGYTAQAFRYDVYGNLLQKGTACFDADPATNRIRQSGAASGSACNLNSAPFSYDTRGQLTYGQAQTIDGTSVADSYGWDPMGRVAKAQRGPLWKNVYDASGERLVRFPPYPDLQTASNNTYTFRDDGNRLSAEYLHTTGAGGESLTLSKSNLYLGSLLVAAYVPTEGGDATWQFYASDHLGSPRLAITHAGYKLKRHRYAAFGDELVVTGETDTLTQRVRFATMERDFEAERYYDHARHQDYNLGRFLSPDLLSGKTADPQSWNRYTYARNNPLKYVDPNGLEVTPVQVRMSGGQPKITYVDSRIVSRLVAFNRSVTSKGYRLEFNDVFRTPQQQKDISTPYTKNSTGSSPHAGLAVDVNLKTTESLADLTKDAAAAGLFPLKDQMADPVHFQATDLITREDNGSVDQAFRDLLLENQTQAQEYEQMRTSDPASFSEKLVVIEPAPPCPRASECSPAPK